MNRKQSTFKAPTAILNVENAQDRRPVGRIARAIGALALAAAATILPALPASADGVVFEASGGWYGAAHSISFQRPDGLSGSSIVHVYARGAQHSEVIRTAQVIPTVRTDARGRTTVEVRVTIAGGESLQTSAAVRGWDASGRERLLAQRGGGGGLIVLDFALGA